MIINEVIWKEKFVKKIESKHKVTTFEVEEILRGKMKVRRVTKGDVEGEDVYLALGQTNAGRYLSVFFILKKNRSVLPISTRDMDSKERRQYERK
ncbi:MAG: BrnT family toxin [Candidatus Desantisbacteria bacterium]